MNTNRGFNFEKELAEQSGEDWALGGTGLTCLAEIPLIDRDKFLPRGELQFGREDFMDCVPRAINNILKMKFTWLLKNHKLNLANETWFKEKGFVVGDRVEFSDRFLAINSGTTRAGNSFKSVLDAARKLGSIPKSKLPAENWMGFDDYHDKTKITIEMFELATEFSKRFFINYERGNESDFVVALAKDPLLTGGFAWPVAVNGVYPRIEANPNHAFIIFKPQYFAFDNYDEDKGPAEDWVKQLAPDFDFLDIGYRITVNQQKFIQKKTSFQLFLEA